MHASRPPTRRDARPRTLAAAVLALAVAALAAGCSSFLPSERSFTRDDIQKRVAQRFPWKRTFAGIIEIELANPLVDLDEARNRVATAFDAQVRVPFAPRVFTGKATLSGIPRYDDGRRAFFFGEPKVDALAIDGVPASVAGELRRIADGLAVEALDGLPVYTLRPEDGKLFGTELTARNIRVQGDRLVVDLAPKGAKPAAK